MNMIDFFLFVEKKNKRKELWRGIQLHTLGATAHTYLETGGYKHIPGNNLAGIKCTRSWLEKKIQISNGICVNAKTKEYINGNTVNTKAYFRAYDSAEHFLLDYSRLIFYYYPVTKESKDCLWGYFAGLHGKWATDPGYFYKLTDVAFSIAPKLVQGYTQSFVNELKIAISRGVLTKQFQKYIEDRLP